MGDLHHDHDINSCSFSNTAIFANHSFKMYETLNIIGAFEFSFHRPFIRILTHSSHLQDHRDRLDPSNSLRRSFQQRYGTCVQPFLVETLRRKLVATSVPHLLTESQDCHTEVSTKVWFHQVAPIRILGPPICHKSTTSLLARSDAQNISCIAIRHMRTNISFPLRKICDRSWIQIKHDLFQCQEHRAFHQISYL
jgi:hypothetical protein